MTDNYFSNIISAIKYIFLTKENYVQTINQNNNQSKIIVIDYCKEKTTCFFCFEEIVLECNLSESEIIKHFFTHYNKSIIYYLSNDIKQILNGFNLNYIKYSEINQECFINTQIPNLSRKINRKFLDKFNLDVKQKQVFIKCLSGFLIQKGFQKSSSINRLDNIQVFKHQNIDENETAKYIDLNSINNMNTNVKLVYNTKNEKICISKINYDRIELNNREKNNYKILNGHPLLPKLFEFCFSKDKPILYIEYINGEDLGKIDIKNFDQNEIINIIFEILIAFHCIHSNGLVYRDLKPDNVLIDSNKVAVLIDFDRIRNLDDFSPISKSLQSKYLAPEIASGCQFNASADIYSLGLLFKNTLLKSENITTDIHSKLKIMCEKCTKESPNDRPTISELIRYFYLNILSNFGKTTILEKLIKILEYYSEKIENLNDPDGFCTLGMIYEHGKCVNIDTRKSINFYIKAAMQGNLIAQMKLYHYYDDQNNEDLAEEYLIRAAEQNDELAQFYLGTKYSFGNKADEKNEENKYKYLPVGIEYLTKSAEQDYIMSEFVLGLFYSHHPKYKDIEKSKEYFLKSLNNENITKPNIFYNYHGKYKLPDTDIISEYELLKGKSIKLFSNTIIGKFYLYGISYEKNIKEAKKYLIDVANHPFIELQSFYEENNIIEINLTKKNIESIDNFIKIVNFVIIECKNTVGQYYLNETYEIPNPYKAIEYFICFI